MNEEIKKFNEFRTDEDGTYYYYNDKNNVEQWSYNLDNLKNYITNLQEENDMLKEGLNYTVPQVRYNKIVNKIFKEYQILKEKNEKLNKIIDGIENYLKVGIAMNFNMNNNKFSEQTIDNYNDILNKLTELKKEVE